MKKYTIRDWATGKVAVFVEKAAEFNTMMYAAEKYGLKWNAGQKPKEFRPNGGEDIILIVKHTYSDERMFYRYKSQAGDIEAVIVTAKELLTDTPSYGLYITSAGPTTNAVLKQNGKVIKRSMAACHPDDKYDFLTGARTALDRMQGIETLKLEEVPTEVLVKEMEKYVEELRKRGKEFQGEFGMVSTCINGMRTTFIRCGAHKVQIVDEEGKSK